MERREFLAFIGSLVFLTGCVSEGAKRNSDSESSTIADECGWPQFCEGSTLVKVVVNSRFSGEVVLETGCRDEDFGIQPGETKTIKRQVDAETCDITLSINDREAYTATINDYESTTLRVNSRGRVDDETTEL